MYNKSYFSLEQGIKILIQGVETMADDDEES